MQDQPSDGVPGVSGGEGARRPEELSTELRAARNEIRSARAAIRAALAADDKLTADRGGVQR